MNRNLDIYVDTGDIDKIRQYAYDNRVNGFTTNPSLMRKAGVRDYETFARAALEAAAGKPVSLEVVSDDPAEMARQAKRIASWGENAYVKIPCRHADGRPTTATIRRLAESGVPLNITAILSVDADVPRLLPALQDAKRPILSVFAGRIADTGRSAFYAVMKTRLYLRDGCPAARVLWASCREIHNLVEAQDCADIITLFPEMIEKLRLANKDLGEYTVETVRGFLEDSAAAGYSL